ncbi:6-hydroxymethylpterin diphosphokinase MptE-like protein [Deinococcus pimensis]|uniref:6-hydroxymethylpterin diphosphokinase MptE-like protein n=1 Tax=Deinococcus pimensis TaxID=309888 RepID=UPI000694FBED|nr:6-hydroxymethylpterin diphosphokinase MptE-like protein [Deinococcus pimensis]
MTTTIKSAFKQIVADSAPGALQLARQLKIAHGSRQLALAHPQTREGLEQLRDRYRGKRCFIMGNGPSLSKMNLSPLKDEYTFGLNRIYLMAERMGWSPSFYVCVNDLVLEQCASEISRIESPKFISSKGRRHFASLPMRDIHWLQPRAIEVNAGITPHGPWHYGTWEGGTVTYVALQLAYHMGFETVILIGVDHHFTTKGTPHAVVTTSAEGDPNHFDKGYFGTGFRWQLPDLPMSELAYSMAKYNFEMDRRVVVDATVGGALTIFPKVEFESLFK